MTFSLRGDSIPTGGSGRVLIIDIGDNNEDTLICRSEINFTSIYGNWYLHLTEMSTDDGDRIVNNETRGWARNRDLD